ncbi:Imm51 family immunity protein, partial [Tsukamurella pulmonis]
MLTDDEDRQFTAADIAELVAVVVALGLLFWLLEPLNPWLKYPAILFGSVAVLALWRAGRRWFAARNGRRERRMEPLRMLQTAPGAHSLILVADGTPSDEAVRALGHEPNGYFWQGIGERLLAGAMAEDIAFDSEAGMFAARSDDPEALTVLGTAMAAVVNDPARLREVVAAAEADGFV